MNEIISIELKNDNFIHGGGNNNTISSLELVEIINEFRRKGN